MLTEKDILMQKLKSQELEENAAVLNFLIKEKMRFKEALENLIKEGKIKATVVDGIKKFEAI